MKILEINKFNFIQGGADRHFLELVKLLKDKGNEVAIFSMHHWKNEPSLWRKYFVSYVGYQKSDSFWLKIKGSLRIFYSFEAKRKIKKLLQDFQPDIVHIHNIYHQISPSILGEIKKKKIPVVMTVHDSKLIYPNYAPNRKDDDLKKYSFWNFVINKKFKNSFLKSFFVALEFSLHKYLNIYDKNIDLYISPSQFVKDRLIEGGIKGEKITILPHFFKIYSSNEKSDIRLQEKYVLHYGRLSEEKGVDRLIKIFEKLPNINLYLAGKIEGGLKIPNLPNIKYVGFQKPLELNRLIKNSLLVISPSILWETFGLIALEAIANGKPFIGFSGLAFSEIIKNNHSGFLVENEEEMEEKIKLLVQDEGLRILFGRNALQDSQKFQLEDYYQKIKTLFGGLILKK